MNSCICAEQSLAIYTQYFDLAQSLVKDYPFGIYEEFTKTVFAVRSEKADKGTLLAAALPYC